MFNYINSILCDYKNAQNLLKVKAPNNEGKQASRRFYCHTSVVRNKRESDIEIAATIGLELLNINSELSDKVDNLTSNLNTSKEMICQLKYELESKQKLLASAFDVDEANIDSDRSTNSQTDVRKWRDQIKRLDAENRGLKHQAEALQREAEECENKEKMLLTSCTCKLGAANAKLDTLYKQVRKKSDECDDLKCRIEQLRGQVITLQSTIKMLTDENDELIEKIASAKSVQGDLEQQVSNLNDSYKECYDVLEISRRDARIWKSRAMSLDYQAQSCAGAKLPSRLRSDCERRSLDLPTDEGHSSIRWSDPKATPGSQLSQTLSTSDESELATKLRLCRLVNERPVDSDGGSHTSRRTLADSGLQSDFDLADSSIGLMELPKQVAINGKLQGGGVTLRRVSVKKPGQLPKIMIVKPFEGSRCLERWRELSVPSIARVLQPRLPGIFSRYDILGSENTRTDVSGVSDDAS